MLTNKDYCDYDTCVALKELGYKVPTSAYYMPHHKDLIWVSNPFRGGYVIDCFYSHNSFPKEVMTANYIDAPTMWEAQKWLREIHNIFVMIDRSFAASNSWHYVICANDDFEHLIEQPSLENYSYEEALSEGIKEAVKILAIC